MSGHSKWATIKRKKGAKDAKRGQAFTRLAHNISLAAKQGGGDLDSNFMLRLAVDKAKAANMPSENIDRAINKGSGNQGELEMVSITYEAYAPGNIAMLIDCQTDNTNRSLTDVKQILYLCGGKLVPEGSVAWLFEEKGLINLKAEMVVESSKFGKEAVYQKVSPDEVMLNVMGISGVEDVEIETDELEQFVNIITHRDKFREVYKAVQQLKYHIESADLVKIAKEQMEVTLEQEEKLSNVLDSLNDSSEVVSVWHNAKINS